LILAKYLKQKQALVDKKLANLLPQDSRFPRSIHNAMRYCATGGKRIRPILCMASCKICKGKESDALLAACAIEMIHAYSLIHDDLPCMDNSDYRRGRPSCHKKFNEAIAVLTGDALMTFAYNVLAGATKDANTNSSIIKEISKATGTFGMIGGQVVDIESSKLKAKSDKLMTDLPTIEYINTHKTGALIASSCKIGSIIANAPRPRQEAIYRYGEYIGFAFQITDDILDNEGFVKIFGIKGAYAKAQELIDKAKEQLSIFKKDREPLLKLADFVLHRKK